MALFRPGYKDAKTGEKRESSVWWYEFTFAGRRIRESSKSTRKTVAAEVERRRRIELEQSVTGVIPREKRKHLETVEPGRRNTYNPTPSRTG